MKLSGSATKTSIRTVLVPTDCGVYQRLFAGSPRKNGAPSTVRPMTLPRFHNSVAPSAFAYHDAASVASDTASITEITGPSGSDVTVCLLTGDRVARSAHSQSLRRPLSGSPDAVEVQVAINSCMT